MNSINYRLAAEVAFFKHYITKIHPIGVVSYVSDTYDFWEVVTTVAAKAKPEIMARQPDALGLNKTVFRPDSGDPVKILCGDPDSLYVPAIKGAVECLWDIFGGTITETGHKLLDAHVGLIYGDSITLDRANQILEQLEAKGFASANVVFGIGSYTYQYNTRDTFGFAMKATYAIIDGEEAELFKDPKTDNGVKKSAKGLLRVEKEPDGSYKLYDQQSKTEQFVGELKPVFANGRLVHETNIDEIRARINETLLTA